MMLLAYYKGYDEVVAINTDHIVLAMERDGVKDASDAAKVGTKYTSFLLTTRIGAEGYVLDTLMLWEDYVRMVKQETQDG